MPDLTVIEGGGGHRPPHHKAKELFRLFLIRLIRAVGGGGSDTDIIVSLREFLVHCAEHDSHWGAAMCEVIDDVRREVFETHRSPDENAMEVERLQLTETCIRFAAEYIAQDQAAPARRSRHRTAMWADIVEIVRMHESECRQHGWSYLADLLEELGDWKGKQPEH